MEIQLEYVEWIHTTPNGERWRALVNMTGLVDLGLHKRRSISLYLSVLLASKEGFCTMELVRLASYCSELIE
jgi:hypothetical protein